MSVSPCLLFLSPYLLLHGPISMFIFLFFCFQQFDAFFQLLVHFLLLFLMRLATGILLLSFVPRSLFLPSCFQILSPNAFLILVFFVSLFASLSFLPSRNFSSFFSQGRNHYVFSPFSLIPNRSFFPLGHSFFSFASSHLICFLNISPHAPYFLFLALWFFLHASEFLGRCPRVVFM